MREEGGTGIDVIRAEHAGNYGKCSIWDEAGFGKLAPRGENGGVPWLSVSDGEGTALVFRNGEEQRRGLGELFLEARGSGGIRERNDENTTVREEIMGAGETGEGLLFRFPGKEQHAREFALRLIGEHHPRGRAKIRKRFQRLPAEGA